MSIPDTSLPPITLSRADADRLRHLAAQNRLTSPDVAAFLDGEVERARILPATDLSPSFIRMGSRVRFRDDGTGLSTHAVLVFPDQEDVERRHVSVLTPVGAALIGLTPGQSIVFSSPHGRRRKLTVLEVEQPEPNALQD